MHISLLECKFNDARRIGAHIISSEEKKRNGDEGKKRNVETADRGGRDNKRVNRWMEGDDGR